MKYTMLQKRNIEIRKNRPLLPSNEVCDVFYDHNLVEICFLSKRCKNDLRGSCIMCDYGAASGTADISEYIEKASDVLSKLDHSVDTILLSTNGSFLDEKQIPFELLCNILEQISKSRINTVEIETYYKDITLERLTLMRQLLPNKKIMIEMGLETINPKYHSHIIMKGISIPDFEKTITLIQNMEMDVECNVMIGLPFLSEKEQYEDALATIQWVFEHQCTPVLFPINIKPYTLLMDMYQSGYYTPISHWMIPILLDTLPTEQLEKITVAWYGNREDIYSACNLRAVFPTSCDRCGTLINEFYLRFLSASRGTDRKKALTNLFSSARCNCPGRIRKQIKQSSAETFETRYSAYINQIFECK